MRKISLFCIFAFFAALALLSTSASAQTLTQVSGTITDPNGLKYTNALITIQLTGGGSTPQTTPCAVSPCNVINPPVIQTDNTGTFHTALWANGSITPGGTQWSFFVAEPGIPLPGGTGAQSFTYTVTITGSSQSLSSGMSALAPALSNITGGGPSITLQTNGVNNGSQTLLNLAAGNGISLSNTGGTTTATATGATADAPNQNVIYVSPHCTNQTNCFQTSWNTQQALDCAWTISVVDVNCSTAHFASGDVGKRIAGYSNCQTDHTIDSSNSLGSQSGTTIATFVSSTHVTVSNAPVGTQASGGCVFWGAPDDTALSAADAAAVAATTCPTVELPMGYGTAVLPHFSTFPNSCLIAPETSGASFVTYGMAVRGQGPDNTKLWLPPDFSLSSCTSGLSGHGCFGTANMYFHDWGLTGGGLNGSGISTTANIVELSGGDTTGYGKLERFNCSNFASSAVNLRGLYVDVAWHGELNHSSIDGCGGVEVEVAAGDLEMYFSGIQDSSGRQLLIDSGAAAFGISTFIQPSPETPANQSVIANNSGSLSLLGGGVLSNGDNAQMIGYHGTGTAAMAALNSIFANGGGGSSQAIRMDNTSTAVLQNTEALAGSGGSSIAILLNGAGTAVTDNGGNTVTPGSVGGGGVVYGSASITGTKQVATNITASTGWGGSGAAGNGISAVGGQTQNEVFTVTAAGTPTANPTLAITFPTEYWIAPAFCSATQTGGTGAVEPLTTAGPSATGVTFTWNGTPVASSTYIISLSCTNY